MNLWEENVLRGNAAILKCHIPSFVTEYVAITSWIISEGDKDVQEINLDSDPNLGNSDFTANFSSYPFPTVLSLYLEKILYISSVISSALIGDQRQIYGFLLHIF